MRGVCRQGASRQPNQGQSDWYNGWQDGPSAGTGRAAQQSPPQVAYQQPPAYQEEQYSHQTSTSPPNQKYNAAATDNVASILGKPLKATHQLQCRYTESSSSTGWITTCTGCDQGRHGNLSEV